MENTGPINQPTTSSTEPIKTTPSWKLLLEKVKPILKSLLEKFYSNKMIFWPVSIFLVIIILIVILGLLFGKKSRPVVINATPIPTPFVLETASPSAQTAILSKSEERLNQLKNQLDQLDIKQDRLKPPILDFNIRF